MTNEQDARLYELLCAYVLGEAGDDERADVERALASSAELRAEKAQLEATIGLVKGTMVSAEKLSPSATADILSRAARPAARPWHAQPWMRIAASVAVLTVGYAAVRSMQSREEMQPAGPFAYTIFGTETKETRQEKKDERIAALDAPARPSPESAPSNAAKNDREKDVTVAYAPSAVSARGEERDYFGDGDALDARANGVGAASDSYSANEPRAQQTLGYAGEKTEVAVATGGSLRSDEGSMLAKSKSSQFPASAAAPGAIGPTGTYRGPSATPPPSSAQPFGPPATSHVDQLRGLGYVGSDEQNEVQFAEAERGRLSSFGYVAGDPGEPRDAKDDSDDTIRKLRELGYFDHGLAGRASREPITPELRERYLDEECRRLLRGCYRRPNERPRDMFFRYWGDNAFEITQLDALSTFSVDVDTASYALARRYIEEGNIPEKSQVRTEEFVNYFDSGVPAPREGTFAIHTDLAPSRFSTDAQRSMLRVVVRGREVTKQERKPLALTFVIDVSGSMREQNRLEMVKHTLRLLVGELDGNDSVAIVVFSSDARLVLPMTSARNKSLIESALFPLQPEQSTNSEAGLRMGYAAALTGLNPNATNRVVFLSDGVANVGVTDAETILAGVQRIREKGIYLNTIGVGMNNHNDTLLEQLADKGDGVCNYVDSPEEARRVMVERFTGSFEPIARDVKVQVEFDPAQVLRYRLLGYENRAIADKDFRNDAVDAGEIGAGHQVTALYEIERANQSSEKPLATVRVRWKAPRVAGRANSEEASEVSQNVLASQTTSFEGAGPGYRRAVIVAQFAEFLRRSQHARGDSFDDLIAEASKLERELQDRDFTELVVLLNKSKALVLQRTPVCDELCQTIDVVRRNQILRAEHELLQGEQNADLLRELERQNAELEAKIRELLRKKLEESK